jgi:hypothetical protein
MSAFGYVNLKRLQNELDLLAMGGRLLRAGVSSSQVLPRTLMKSVLHPDGVKRITMKIEVAVSIPTLTLYALDMVKLEQDPAGVILAANKREIFALARANIQAYGQDTAISSVPLVIDVASIQQVEQHVSSVFPELR